MKIIRLNAAYTVILLQRFHTELRKLPRRCEVNIDQTEECRLLGFGAV
jgi:hypothetical protein